VDYATLFSVTITAMMKTIVMKFSCVRRLRKSLACALLICSLAAPLVAGEKYLEPAQFDGIALLLPPPEPGSREYEADLHSIRFVFNSATPEEKEFGEKRGRLSLFDFAPAIGEDFKRGKYPKVEHLFETVRTNIGGIIETPKNHWKRTRPYLVDTNLALGRPESSFSYPSGHSTRGIVYSLMLAEIFPEKREGILEIGRGIGWDRVVIGKHFPTDVYAGRILGKAVFRELMKNNGFGRDLAEAKAEAEAARSTAIPAN
jgi:acid phosphatase (class A)